MVSAIEIDIIQLGAGFTQHQITLKVSSWNNKGAIELLNYSLSKLPEAINKSKAKQNGSTTTT